MRIDVTKHFHLGDSMIVEYTRYKIDENRRVAFVNDYREAAESLKCSKNCLGYELTQCTEDEGYFILRIEWDSEEGHLKRFRNSSEFKAFFPNVRPYDGDIEEMRHYRLTDIREKKG
ncbi:MAG TPA: antibiotic biosynthesis monooxygenase family protein [Candidatus Acidoferrum sp.]|nr:antibiotic biosynthesis monooxygenase family protein [Candidatus Acidoferrum sp.]